MKRKDIFLDLIMLGTVSVVFNLVDIRICPFFYLFNIPCPGCGLTRSVLAIFKLDIKSIVQYNFLGIIIVIGFIFYFLAYFFDKRNIVNTFLVKNRKMVIITAIVLLIIAEIINFNNKLLY